MFSENKPKSTRIENGPVLILGLILIALILMTICALSVIFLKQRFAPRPTVQQDLPVIVIPKALPPTAMPATHFSILLPIVPSGSIPVSAPVPASTPNSEHLWIVTKIKKLGYELDGRRYDFATFKSIDGQEIAKGYCINRGWDIPKIGTEYMLTTDGTFVPLQEPEADPYQRFLKVP